MSKHGFGKNQPLIDSPVQLPKTKGPLTDFELIQILHNLRFQDEAIIERTVKFLRGHTTKLLEWLDDADHPYLGHVVTAMRFLHEARAVPKLIPLASSADPLIAEAVLLALIVLKDPTSLPVFVTALASKSDKLRYMAATGIAAVGDKQCAAALESAIAKEAEFYVVDQMKTALAQIKTT